MQSFRTGCQMLDMQERNAYSILEKALSDNNTSISLSNIPDRVNVMKVMQTVLCDHPEFFCYDISQIRIVSGGFFGKKLQLALTCPAGRVSALRNELDSAVTAAVREISSGNTASDHQKLLGIYNYMQKNSSYDMKEFTAYCSNGQASSSDSHTAYGALVKKRAVCDGLAAAFQIIAQKMGFECTMIRGSANFLTSSPSPHAWDIVRVDGKFCHIDPTWDINLGEQMNDFSYEYFCVSDKVISTDHQWDKTAVPQCITDSKSYYSKKGCIASAVSQIDDIFKTAIMKKESAVRLRLAERVALPGDPGEYLAQKLMGIAEKFGETGSLQYTWNKSSRCFMGKFQ